MFLFKSVCQPYFILNILNITEISFAEGVLEDLNYYIKSTVSESFSGNRRVSRFECMSQILGKIIFSLVVNMQNQFILPKK